VADVSDRNPDKPLVHLGGGWAARSPALGIRPRSSSCCSSSARSTPTSQPGITARIRGSLSVIFWASCGVGPLPFRCRAGYNSSTDAKSPRRRGNTRFCVWLALETHPKNFRGRRRSVLVRPKLHLARRLASDSRPMSWPQRHHHPVARLRARPRRRLTPKRVAHAVVAVVVPPPALGREPGAAEPLS